MKTGKIVFLTGLFGMLVSACTINHIQRDYEEVNNTEPVVIIVHEPVYIPEPAAPFVIVQPQPEAPKTKLRKEGATNNSKGSQRESSDKKDNVRNNSGQRNTKSRGN